MSFNPQREQRRGPLHVEVATLFQLLGKSVWYLQHLEDALSTSIALKRDIKTRGSISEERANHILASHRKRTLGGSIEVARKAEIFTKIIQERLDEFLLERNWLIHRLIHENGSDMNVNGRREKLLQRIEDFVDEAQSLQRAIGEDLLQFVASQGVSLDWVEAHAQKEFAKGRGEEVGS